MFFDEGMQLDNIGNTCCGPRESMKWDRTSCLHFFRTCSRTVAASYICLWEQIQKFLDNVHLYRWWTRMFMTPSLSTFETEAPGFSVVSQCIQSVISVVASWIHATVLWSTTGWCCGCIWLQSWYRLPRKCDIPVLWQPRWWYWFILCDLLLQKCQWAGCVKISWPLHHNHSPDIRPESLDKTGEKIIWVSSVTVRNQVVHQSIKTLDIVSHCWGLLNCVKLSN